MNNADRTLQITYTGKPVRVNAKRITRKMSVPDLGWSDSRPGSDAVTLFTEAEATGALAMPEGITVDCYSRDTDEAHDFMLVAYPAGSSGAGVTDGWFDVELLAERDGTHSQNERAAVRGALEVMAAKIDAALNSQ
jgi:hypothetical protein